MSTSHRILILCFLLSCTTGAGAQPLSKNLSQLLRASFTAPRMVLENGALSSAQKHLLESQLTALEETRRALVQNPGWAVSKDFNLTAKRLARLELPVPPKPKADAPTAEKERYLKRLNKLLYRESKALASVLGQQPRPYTPDKRLNWEPLSTPRQQALTRDHWEQILASGNPSFTWGTQNWDEVQVNPLRFATNPNDPDYIPEEAWEELTWETGSSKYEFYNAILDAPALTSRQKQLLICAAEEASAVLTYEFVQLYVPAFGMLPQAVVPSAAGPDAHAGLEAYATAVQKKLLLKLQDEGSWSPADFERFAQVSVFLPAEKAQAVLGAATFLETQAPLWLLEHPLDHPLSQEILKRTQDARLHQQERWPDGVILPKAKLSNRFKLLYSARRKALQAYSDLLWNRLQKLLDKQDSARRAAQILTDHPPTKDSTVEDKKQILATWIFISAREARLQKNINEVSLRLHQTKEELGRMP